MKRFFAILLALVMVLALSLTVFAEGEQTGTITINPAMPGQTYSAYKLFDLTYATTSGGGSTYAYTYTKGTAEAPNDWDAFFFDGGAGATYVTIRDDGYVSWIAGVDSVTDRVAFAKAALAYAKAPKSETDTAPRVSPDKSETAAADTTTVTLNPLSLGYYLVDSSQGALCALTSVSPNASIQEKNGAPGVTKSIVIDDAGNTADWNSASIGDKIQYQTYFFVRNGAENYVLHDTMEPGLTLDKSTINVLYYASSIDAVSGDRTLSETPTPLTARTDYTITYPAEDAGAAADADTFTVTFFNATLDTIPVESKIVVTYSATLNNDAEIGTANVNETYLTYGDGTDSLHDLTATYSWQFLVKKVNDKSDVLEGAVFQLSTDAEGKNLLYFENVTPTPAPANDEPAPASNDTITRTYRLSNSTAEGVTTSLTTDSAGTFYLSGLNTGTYYLTEISAPIGYTKLEKPITIEITDYMESSGTDITQGVKSRIRVGTDAETTIMSVEVINTSGAQLPSTGGIGVTVFYVTGGALILAAVVLCFVVIRRRKSDGSAS